MEIFDLMFAKQWFFVLQEEGFGFRTRNLHLPMRNRSELRFFIFCATTDSHLAS
jgi:hypothetical protein